MQDSKPFITLMAASPPLSKTKGTPLPNLEQYRKIVGALQYLNLTRLDIAFNVNKQSQFLYCAVDVHWEKSQTPPALHKWHASCGFAQH
jgi:hypothetical protein